MVKNDVWYKPLGDGEIKMHVYDGAFWNEEAYSADSLGGTVNFANINAINLNLNALTTASISGANFWLKPYRQHHTVHESSDGRYFGV